LEHICSNPSDDAFCCRDELTVAAAAWFNRCASSLQDLLLAFVDCVERNGAKLAHSRTVLEMHIGAHLQQSF
jgi:hypothetical protein